MSLVWFLIFISLLIFEVLTVNLVTIWFALGAVSGVITSMFTDDIFIQLIVFVFTSIISLILTKPIVKKMKKFEFQPTNYDRVIGKVGEVTKEITEDGYGEVKVLSNFWTAVSENKIKEGSKVKILGIDGVKLIVEKEEVK